ncbi:hypothetical protein BDN67DRAFT_1013564 [Paxillus ammoniavirescens]|nr:hypothetical protein BDN67DRAFT_1013564 [Paxillus ammoniavirescens]
MNVADEAYMMMEDTITRSGDPLPPARVRSLMVQDLAVEPLRASSPVQSILSRAMGHGKMEVVINKGKGRKRSCQDLTQEEASQWSVGMSCQKCVLLKHKCMDASRGKAGGGSASAAQPTHPSAVKAGPSNWTWASTASDKDGKEEPVIVMKAPPKIGKAH